MNTKIKYNYLIIFSIIISCSSNNTIDNTNSNSQSKDKIMPSWLNSTRSIEFSNMPDGDYFIANRKYYYTFALLINDGYSKEDVKQQQKIIDEFLRIKCKEKLFAITQYASGEPPPMVRDLNIKLNKELFRDVFIKYLNIEALE